MKEYDFEELEVKKEHGDFLSISEMRELLQQAPYKPYDDEYPTDLSYDDQTGMYYTDYFKEQRDDHILLRHILAELCIAHKEELDWSRVTDGYDAVILAHIIGLYNAPLAWCEIPHGLTEKYVIIGKFAREIEEKRDDYEELINFVLNEVREKRALWFADHLPARGIAKWETFLSNYRRAELLSALSPRSDKYIELPKVNKLSLEENLGYVIAHRGIEKAREVLERLKKDWNHLVKLKLCDFDRLSNEEIEVLYNYVFDAVDYKMELWQIEYGADNDPIINSAQSPSDARFSLLTDECYEEKKESKVISELRTACKGTAVGLWKVIRTNEALGYLGTRGMQTSKIYRAIVDYFRDARDKK